MNTEKSGTPTPSKTGEDVVDPHPGSISDGTHPEASEVKLPRGKDKAAQDCSQGRSA